MLSYLFVILFESAFRCNILHLWMRKCKQWCIVHVIEELFTAIQLFYYIALALHSLTSYSLYSSESILHCVLQALFSFRYPAMDTLMVFL